MINGDRLPASRLHLLQFLFVSLCYHHRETLNSKLHPKNKLRSSVFFNSIPPEIIKLAEVRLPSDCHWSAYSYFHHGEPGVFGKKFVSRLTTSSSHSKKKWTNVILGASLTLKGIGSLRPSTEGLLLFFYTPELFRWAKWMVERVLVHQLVIMMIHLLR